MRYPFRLPFNHPMRIGFSLPGFGALPPISDELLVWIEWEDGATTQQDKWLRPNAENMINTSGDLYAFEETPLGTMNVGDVITVSLKLGETITSILIDGTCVAVVDVVTNKITVTVAGTIRNIKVIGTQEPTALYPSDTLFPSDTLYPSGD